MKTNEAGLALIKSFEGLELKAYQDSVGVWTIGYGHTSAAGSPAVKSGMTITAQQAEEMLKDDLGQYEDAVSKAVTSPINENQFAALVSFTYNLGPANFRSSTLLKKINAGDYNGAADEFSKWNKAGGKVLSGLTRRRAAERELFLRPVDEAESPEVQLQRHLADLGLYSMKVDGIWGKGSQAALDEYNERAHDIADLVSQMEQK